MNPRFLWAGILCLLALFAFRAAAAPPTSITLDGSLGHGVGAVNPTSPSFYQITPSMGMSVGSNIFQSFGVFNLGTGDTADFEANVGTQNIIARVTGGSASSIDGTITSTIGSSTSLSSANLFLINPAGIMFTANASLNLNGAFVASTANYVKLSDGTFFYADTQHPINDAGLTSAPVSAFGFLPGNTPQPISFSGTQFTNAGGIHVIGGDLTLDQGTTLLAPGGNLTLFSAAGSGEVPFNLSSPGTSFASATNTSYGNITIQNHSTVAIDSGQGGGNLVIRGGKIVVAGNSEVSSYNSSGNAGGDISVLAGSLTLQDYGSIRTIAGSSGNAGDITITANAISINGTGAPAFANSGIDNGVASLAEDSGNAGSVNIVDSGPMTLLNGGLIVADSYGSGDAGSITIQAASLNIEDTRAANSAQPTGIEADSLLDAGNFSAGGYVLVNVSGPMTLLGDAYIESAGYNFGNAGNVTVTAQTLTMKGSAAAEDYASIDSEADGAFYQNGNSGNVNVTVAGAMSILGNAEIDADTYTCGNAGQVTVQAANLTLDGSAMPKNFTGITADAQNSGSNFYNTGNAGSVTVNVSNALTLLGNSAISADTYTSGNGGSVTVTVTAGTMLVNGTSTPKDFTGVSALTGAEDFLATGAAGSVIVTVDGLLSLMDHSSINADSSASGNAGQVSVQAGSLAMTGAKSTISANANSMSDSGGQTSAVVNAGTVGVAVTGNLTMSKGASVSASGTGYNRAGSASISAAVLSIAGGSKITASAFAQGGSVTINAVSVSLTGAGTGIEALGGGTINMSVGGDLTLTDDALIASGDEFYNAPGSITISAGGAVSLAGGADIFSEGNQGGAISLTAASLSLDGAKTEISSANTDGIGNGAPPGSTYILLSGTMAVTNGAVVSVSGPLSITADSLSIDGAGSVIESGEAYALNLVVGGDISITNGGSISLVNQYGFASPGGLTITGGSLDLDGAGSTISTDSSNYNGSNQNGPAIGITITGAATITNGAVISSTDESPGGTSGAINLSAASLTDTGAGSAIQALSGASLANAGAVSVSITNALDLNEGGKITSETSNGGNSGAVTATAGAIDLESGGQIVSSTLGAGFVVAGNAGPVNVSAGTIAVDGASSVIQSLATLNGSADTVNVSTAGVLSLTNGGRIVSTSLGSGNGGSVTVTAGSLEITNGGEIESAAFGGGDGGAVSVTAGSVDIGGASLQFGTTGIIAESLGATANPGSLTLDVTNGLSVEDGGEVAFATPLYGNNGPISLQAGSVTINGAGTAIAGLQNGVFANPLSNQYVPVTLDGSLGGSSSMVFGPIYVMTPSMGREIDGNLFYSLGRLSLSAGDMIDFEADGGTQTILARVTGGSVSAIDGVIVSTTSGSGALSAANLVLVNPAGLTLTANAGVNLSGALALSTANTVNLANTDGTLASTFYADTVHPQDDVSLSSAPVAGFTFTEPAPAPISFSGTQLGNMGDFNIIGGSVMLENGTNVSTSNSVAIFSAGGAGNVPFRFAAPMVDFTDSTVTSFGNITLRNQVTLTTDSAISGNITLQGAQITVNDTTISSTYEGATTGGNILFQATGLTVEGGSVVSTDFGSLTTTSEAFGNITAAVNGPIDIDESNIFTEVKFPGAVSLTADSLSMNDGSVAGGRAYLPRGTVNLTIHGAASLTNNSSIEAGVLTIGSQSLSMTHSSMFNPDSQTTITVAGELSLNQSTATLGTFNFDFGGSGGPLTKVTAGQINLNDSSLMTGAFTHTAVSGNYEITTTTGDFSLVDSRISTVAANIGISCAGTIKLSDGSSITANPVPYPVNAGNITINAVNLSVSSSTLEAKAPGGGDLTLRIDGFAYFYDSLVDAEGSSGGYGTNSGGNVSIDSEMVVVDHATFNANDSSTGGSGGNITIITPDYLDQFSVYTATGETNNGSITISAPDLNLSGSLLPLPQEIITDESKLKESCARSANHEYSSLVVVGRGGTELAPDELQPDFGLDETSTQSPATSLR